MEQGTIATASHRIEIRRWRENVTSVVSVLADSSSSDLELSTIMTGNECLLADYLVPPNQAPTGHATHFVILSRSIANVRTAVNSFHEASLIAATFFIDDVAIIIYCAYQRFSLSHEIQYTCFTL